MWNIVFVTSKESQKQSEMKSTKFEQIICEFRG